MLDLAIGALLGKGAFALFDRLRNLLRDGQTVELVAGLAYLRVLAAEHDDLPPLALPAAVRSARDPVAALAAAVEALGAAAAFRADADLMQALHLPAHAERLGAEALGEMMDALALSADAETALAAVEDALSAAMTGPGRFRGGDYYTAPRVVELVSRLLRPTPGSRVYDPTCGTASLLVGAFHYATQDGGAAPLLFGQDLNPTAVALSRVRAHLLGASADVALGDVLRAPVHTDGDRLETFDFVVGNPPRGVRLNGDDFAADPYNRFPDGVGAERTADAAFLAHAVASLAPGGRAVLTTTPQLLQATSFSAVRRWLLAEDVLEAVVSLPADFFQHAGTAAPPLLVLNRNKPADLAGCVVFVEAETGVVPDHVLVDRVVATAGQASAQRGLSAVVQTADILARSADLSPSAYVPLVETEQFMGGGGRRVSLSGLADVIGGRAVKSSGEGPQPVIRGRDVRGRLLSLASLDRVDIETDHEDAVSCRTGDVVLPVVSARPAAATVPIELDGALADVSVLIVRPSPPDAALTGYLVDLFNSDLGQTLLKSVSSWLRSDRQIHRSALSALEIPLPDDAVLALLAHVRDTEDALRERGERAREVRERLFSLDDPGRFDDAVRQLRSDADILARSLGETESLTYRVRNFYPFPLAYRYRELDSLSDVRERHKALLDVAENTLAFLGSLGLALALDAGALSTDDTARFRALWQGGLTIGNWEMLARGTAKAIRVHQRPVSPLAEDFAAVWFEGRGKKQSDFSKTVELVVGLRNAAHHGGGPVSSADYEQACTDLNNALDVAFEGLSWTIAYPLRLVQSVESRWRSPVMDAETLRYTGDHPALQRETIPTPSLLVSGHLYVETGTDALLSLYPLLSVHACPACKRRETYYVDYWNGTGEKTKLKSFERSGGDHQLATRVTNAPEAPAASMVAADMGEWFAPSTP